MRVSLVVLQGIEDDQVDLRREIAFNLSLIYQASGNKEMARYYIHTYCVVWVRASARERARVCEGVRNLL